MAGDNMAVDKATLLQQAEAAYHQLMLGQGVAEFRDQNGETVRYTPSRKADLWGYILQLRAELGKSSAGRPGRAWFV